MAYPINPYRDRICVVLDNKKKFVDKCYLEGRSMTDVLRSLIDSYMEAPLVPRDCPAHLNFTYAKVAKEARGDNR